VQKKTLAKEASLPSVKNTLGKETFCRVFFIWHSAANSFFAECPKKNTQHRVDFR
jgi:hypothetical protein